MSKVKQTFLDKLVSFVSPQAGVQRMMAKKALTKFEYDAVKYTRERRGPSNLSGAEDYRSNYDRVELMKRARDLAENNGLVRSLLLKFASHVAANITYQARTENPKANTEIEAYWSEWFDNCDLSTRHTGSTLMQVATVSMLRDGDFLFVLVRDKNGDLRLQGIEADRLGDPYKTYTSLELIGGIHIDRDTGAPTAYDIFNRSIGDFYTYQVTIPASQAFHYFDPLRIDQYRGISAFHTAINDATDIYDIVNFEKLAAKVASSQGAIVKRTNNNASDLTALTTEENFDNQPIKLETMEAGKVSYLEPGEDIVFPDGPSRPSGAFAEFHKILLRNICMGLGIPYSFAVDPSSMSGPTARLEMQQAGRTFRRYQKLLDDKVLRPLKNIVIADAVARGIISGNGKTSTKGFFNFGANVSIDLGRESASAIAEFKAGLRTASDIYSERGMDVEAALRARAIETKMIQDLAKEYGVPPQAVSEILLPTGQPQAQAEQPTQDGQQVEGQPDLIGQSLNGAQVASLINVINAVAAGALSKEGAVSVITAAFPTISREQAMGIVAGVQTGKMIPTTEKEKQAWNGWGGDAGYAWARKVVRQMEARDKNLSNPQEPTELAKTVEEELNPCGMKDDGTFDERNTCSQGYGRPKNVGGYTPKRPGGKIPKQAPKPAPPKIGLPPKPAPKPPPPKNMPKASEPEPKTEAEKEKRRVEEKIRKNGVAVIMPENLENLRHVEKSYDNLVGKGYTIPPPDMILTQKFTRGNNDSYGWAMTNYTTGTQTIALNSKYFNTDQYFKDKKNDLESEWTTNIDTFAHEYGHILHAKNVPYEEWMRLRRGKFGSGKIGASRKAIARQVGRYATKNPLEFVAEVFNGSVNGKQYSGEVMEMYKFYKGPEIK